MKLWKILGALVAAAALGGAAFGVAASLNVNGGTLQAGSAPVGGCQGGVPISPSFSTHYNNVIGFMAIDAVTMSGISEKCFPASGGGATDSIDVVLTFKGGLFQDLGTIPITGSSVTWNIPAASQPAAADLTDLHGAIY